MNESLGRHHRSAEEKAEAVIKVEVLVKNGVRVSAAIGEVALRCGIGKRTLFTLLDKTKGVPESQLVAALAPKPRRRRARKTCHLDAPHRTVPSGEVDY